MWVRMEGIGQRIRRFRESKGLQLVELAKAARISKGYLSSIEHGRKKIISGPIIERLARALDAATDELLRGTPAPVSKETVRIDDPDIRLFFSGDWDSLDDSEKDWIRRAIKIAKEKQQGSDDARGHSEGGTGQVQGDEAGGGG